MADTSIEWTDKVWNPTTGCDRVSPGCDHCYAMGLAKRWKAAGQPKYQTDGDPRTSGPGFGVAVHEDALTIPLRTRTPRRWFVNSMSDLFHPRVPDEFIARVFAVMAQTPHHTYQILTKRAPRMRSLVGAPGDGGFRLLEATTEEATAGTLYDALWPLRNVWLGVSVEDQYRAAERIPILRSTDAAVHWISAEPLLSPVDLSGFLPGLDWVVAGGESGPGARPMHPAWVRVLRDQCVEAEVPFLLKQWGQYAPAAVYDHPGFAGGGRAFNHPRGGAMAAIIREGGKVRAMRPGDATSGGLVMLDRDTVAVRVGKKAAGRMLDGELWDQYPAAVSNG